MNAAGTRILDHRDLEQCINIAKHKHKISGIPTDFTVEIEQAITTSLSSTDDMRRCIGYFEHDTLISWISIVFAVNKRRGKFWIISQLYSSRQQAIFSFNNPEIGLLTKAAFEIAEGRGHNKYFYTVSLRLQRVYQQQWKKNLLGFNGRYQMTLLDIVPANTQPTIELYWKLMNQTIKSEPIAVMCRELK